MKRRRLIKLVALSLSGLALPAVWLRRSRANDVFDDLFGDSDIAARIGEIRQIQDEKAGDRGRNLIADLDNHPSPAREKRLRKRALADFAALDVVVVDGWVMARSEADLCAAVHLDRSLA